MDCDKPTTSPKKTTDSSGQDCGAAESNANKDALAAALDWGFAQGDCPKNCETRTVTTDISLGQCKDVARQGNNPAHKEVTCTWTASVMCTAALVQDPTGKKVVHDRPTDGTIGCDEVWEKHGSGIAYNPLGGNARGEARKSAKQEAVEAMQRAKVEGKCCADSDCPKLRVTISIGAPKDPAIVDDPDPNAKSGSKTYKSECEWKVMAECYK